MIKLIIALSGIYSWVTYAQVPMNGVDIVPNILNGVGRILECTQTSGTAVTFIWLGSRDSKSLMVTRQTMDYSAKIRSWKTYEFIPLDKISILDSLKEKKYELTFNSILLNFHFILTNDLTNKTWRAKLNLDKELFLNIKGNELICKNPEPELQSWIEKRIRDLKI